MSVVHFDVAVVGSEICALAAGAMLAHEHKKVVVIDDGEADETPLGELLVPRAPTLWRLPTSGPAAELIEKLGQKQDARRVLGPPAGIAIVDDPDVRLIVDTDATRRARELDRAFGGPGLAASHALSTLRSEARDGLLVEATLLHEEGFFARRREKKRQADGGSGVDPSSTDDAVRALLSSTIGPALPMLVPFVQHALVDDASGVAGFLAAWTLAGGTVAHPTEGTSLRGALARRFLHTIEGHGGDVLRGVRVREVEGDARRVTVVRTTDKNDYAVRALVDGTEARALTTRLPAGRGRDETTTLAGAAAMSGGAAVVRLLVDRGALPRGLSARTLVLPDGDVLDEPMVVAVYDGLATLDGRPARGASAHVAVVASAKAKSREQSEQLAARMRRRLTQLMPFANAKVAVEDTLFGDEAWRALPTYAPGKNAHLLGGARPSTGFKNVVRAGRDLAPRLGLEGEIAAARAVMALVDEVLGKKRPLGDD